MFGTDLIISPERPITEAVHGFSLERVLSDPENRSQILFNIFFLSLFLKYCSSSSHEDVDLNKKCLKNPLPSNKELVKQAQPKAHLFQRP